MTQYKAVLWDLYGTIISRRIKLNPYIKETIKVVYKQSIKQACVSSMDRDSIAEILNDHNIAKYFEHWIGLDDVASTKPSPAPYLLSCKLLNINPVDCIVIEDSISGIISAKKANITTVAYVQEHNDYTDFKDADHIVYDIRKFLPLLTDTTQIVKEKSKPSKEK